MLKFKSIKSKLILYLSITLIPILIILLYSGKSYIKKILYKSTLFNAKISVTKAARDIENLTSEISEKPREIADIVGNNISDIEKTENLMKKYVKENKFIYGMALAFYPEFSPNKSYYSSYYYLKNGKLIYKQLVPPSYDYLNSNWFFLPVKLKKNIWSEPYFDKGGGELWMSTYSAIIKNNEGKPIGIATADVSIRFLTEIVERIKILKTGRAFLFSKEGNLIAPTMKIDKKNNEIYVVLKGFNKENLKKIAKECLWKDGLSKELFFNKTKYFVYYMPLRKTDWIIGIIFPEKELFAPLKRIELYSVLLILGVLFLVIGVITIISRNVTKDINRIKSVSLEIAKGNFDVEIPQNFMYEAKSIAEALNTMQISLKKYIEEVKEKSKLENELLLAHKIQSSFVPNKTDVEINGFSFKAVSLWAKQVGGDFYGINKIDDNKILFYLGDVSGKGIPAVLYVAMVKGMIEVLINQTHSIKEIASLLNKFFANITKHNTFATMFIGLIDKKEGKLHYANLGHIPPIFIDINKLFSPILSGNIPVGVFPDFNFKTSTIDLKSFNQIIIFSDGVLDAKNSRGQTFENEKLIEVLKKVHNRANLINYLIDEITNFVDDTDLYDDTTILNIIRNLI